MARPRSRDARGAPPRLTSKSVRCVPLLNDRCANTPMNARHGCSRQALATSKVNCLLHPSASRLRSSPVNSGRLAGRTLTKISRAGSPTILPDGMSQVTARRIDALVGGVWKICLVGPARGATQNSNDANILILIGWWQNFIRPFWICAPRLRVEARHLCGGQDGRHRRENHFD